MSKFDGQVNKCEIESALPTCLVSLLSVHADCVVLLLLIRSFVTRQSPFDFFSL
jgi:hypothetical protein